MGAAGTMEKIKFKNGMTVRMHGRKYTIAQVGRGGGGLALVPDGEALPSLYLDDHDMEDLRAKVASGVATLEEPEPRG